jgi:hypothetical protein
MTPEERTEVARRLDELGREVRALNARLDAVDGQLHKHAAGRVGQAHDSSTPPHVARHNAAVLARIRGPKQAPEPAPPRLTVVRSAGRGRSA